MDTLRNYTFLPWTRQGIAAEISVVDDLGTGSGPARERAEVSVSFTVNGQPVSKHVQVLGPGDVVGINPRAIVKTEPRHWVTDFESNYLPYIEFYEEDFPWRFTPAEAANSLAGSRLRPWICLVVLKEDEFEEERTSGPLSAFAIKDDLDLSALFPPPQQSWAWAHVHVSRNIIGDQLQTTEEEQVRGVEQNLEQTLRVNADSASSRLICPRKLEDNTVYHAFVIPAFEAGRFTGLGSKIPPEPAGSAHRGAKASGSIRSITAGSSERERRAILNFSSISSSRAVWTSASAYGRWTCRNQAMKWTGCRDRSASWVWKAH